MDKLKKYQNVVKKAILKYADFQDNSREESEIQPVFDEKRNHYFLMDIGWKNMHRIHTCLLHIDIKNDKIWIHKDFVEQGIATDLMEMGIPKSDIVLGFQAPYKRPYTEFAVA
jgi:hypothetical protein